MNVAMNTKKCVHVCVFTPLYDTISCYLAAGALAHVNVDQARAIHKAVIDGKWATARELIDAARQGKLSDCA